MNQIFAIAQSMSQGQISQQAAIASVVYQLERLQGVVAVYRQAGLLPHALAGEIDAGLVALLGQLS